MKQSTLENGKKVDFNSIYQADKNKFTSFKKLTRKKREPSGSCFVTLSSKHFLRIGGSSGPPKIIGSEHTETALKSVKLFSYENRQLLVHGTRGGLVNQVSSKAEGDFGKYSSLHFLILFFNSDSSTQS